MTNPATTQNVWAEIRKELFAVLGMVTADGQSRTVGIVYVVADHKLYIGTGLRSWKARHIQNNSAVSLTIPIAKRIPVAPWIKIPQATISFSGKAKVIPAQQAQDEVLKLVFRHKAGDAALIKGSCLIEIVPEGEFITYGIGIPLMQMRHAEKARGRAPVR